MGGSGGASGGAYSPGRYDRMMRESIDTTRVSQFNDEVNTGISEILTEYNSRDTVAVSEHLDEIRSLIEEDTGRIDLSYGGSVKKHTYVDGLSDIDVILTVNRSELIDSSPKEILKYIESKLRNHLSDVEEIRVGDLAVTVRFHDALEIQLLPAIQTKNGFKIAEVGVNKWSDIIRPEKFVSKLTEVNQNCGGKVIPTIKLAKGLFAGLPKDQRLTGYHVESMAIETFENYPSSLPRSPKQMLEYFVHRSSEIIKKPIVDKTSQSLHVDDYLGSTGSIEREKIAYSLNAIHNRMMNANQTTSAGDWLRIVEGD